MSDFIKVEQTKKNELRCDGGFEIFGISLDKLDFKIDTGCPRTTIPLRKTPLSNNTIAYNMNKDYMDATVKKQISFGVNDSKTKRDEDRLKFKQGLYDQLDSVTCVKTVNNFIIGGCNVGNIDINVSYIRTGNILIGMDILGKMDMHMAESIKTSQVILLACPLDRISKSYIQALIEEFDIGQRVIDDLHNKMDCKAVETH